MIWLHTFGQRFADPDQGRPQRPPQLDTSRRPRVATAIPTDPGRLPERIAYHPDRLELHVGDGVIAPVEPAAWDYEVSGLRVIRHWFGYRKRDPEGQRSSPLDDITHDAWDPAWTTELLEIINVLILLADREASQRDLLDRIVDGPLLSVDELIETGIVERDHVGAPQPPKAASKTPKVPKADQPAFDTLDLAAEDGPRD